MSGYTVDEFGRTVVMYDASPYTRSDLKFTIDMSSPIYDPKRGTHKRNNKRKKR